MNCNNEKCVLEKCSNCNNIELSKIGLNDSELQKETNKYLPVKYISDEYKCNFSTDIHKNSKNYIKRPNVLKFHNQKSKDHIEQINEKEASQEEAQLQELLLGQGPGQLRPDDALD